MHRCICFVACCFVCLFVFVAIPITVVFIQLGSNWTPAEKWEPSLNIRVEFKRLTYAFKAAFTSQKHSSTICQSCLWDPNYHARPCRKGVAQLHKLIPWWLIAMTLKIVNCKKYFSFSYVLIIINIILLLFLIMHLMYIYIYFYIIFM